MQKTSVIIGAAVLAAMAGADTASAQTTLRIDSFASPRHIMNAAIFPTWGKQVEEATEGRVKVTLTYPPNVNPATFYDRLADGVTDVAWSFHGYNPGRFVATQVAELPGLDADAEQATIAYQRINDRHLYKAGEHKEIKILTVFAHGDGMLHTRQLVTTIDQMKGLKVRIGGGVAADVVRALGMVEVPVPATKVYEVLAQGVADGALMTMEVKQSFKLKEVAPYTLTFPGGLYTGTFFIGMNLAKFDKLSRADQEAINRVSGETLAKYTGRVWADAEVDGLQDAKAAGNTIQAAAPAEVSKLRQRLEHIERDWLVKAANKGFDPKVALEELRAEVKKLKQRS